MKLNNLAHLIIVFALLTSVGCLKKRSDSSPPENAAPAPQTEAPPEIVPIREHFEPLVKDLLETYSALLEVGADSQELKPLIRIFSDYDQASERVPERAFSVSVKDILKINRDTSGPRYDERPFVLNDPSVFLIKEISLWKTQRKSLNTVRVDMNGTLIDYENRLYGMPRFSTNVLHVFDRPEEVSDRDIVNLDPSISYQPQKTMFGIKTINVYFSSPDCCQAYRVRMAKMPETVGMKYTHFNKAITSSLEELKKTEDGYLNKDATKVLLKVQQARIKSAFEELI